MEQTPPVIDANPPEPQPPAMSLPARLLNVFAIPGDVFEEVKRSPSSTANWLVPALLLILVGCIGASLIYSQPAVQQQVRDMQEKVLNKLVESGRLPREQADRQLEASGVSSQVGAYIGPVFMALVTPFGWGLLIWLLGTKLFKGSFPFMKAVEVAGLSNAIAVLGSIVQTLLVVGLGDMFASASPALLTKMDPQEPSFAVLAVLNVMTLWVLTVRAIGLARLSGVTFLRSAPWVFGIWATYTFLLVGIGLAVRRAFGF